MNALAEPTPDTQYARYQEWHPTGIYAVSKKQHWPFPARKSQGFTQMQLTIDPSASVLTISDDELFDAFWKFYQATYPEAYKTMDNFIVKASPDEVRRINKEWTNKVKSKYDIVHIPDGDEHIILNNTVVQNAQPVASGTET